MLAGLGDLPVGGGWAYEVKWDGVRTSRTDSMDVKIDRWNAP